LFDAEPARSVESMNRLGASHAGKEVEYGKPLTERLIRGHHWQGGVEHRRAILVKDMSKQRTNGFRSEGLRGDGLLENRRQHLQLVIIRRLEALKADQRRDNRVGVLIGRHQRP